MTIPLVVMSFTAVAADYSIRICQKNVALRPWRRRGRFGDVCVGDESSEAANGGAEVGPEVVIGASVSDVGVGEDSTGAANGGVEDGPQVVIVARAELGASSGGVGGEKMALGTRAGAE
jgi:hypothetical protein